MAKAHQEDNADKGQTPLQQDKFIVAGYRAAIVLAFLGIILSSLYLFLFINKSNPSEIQLNTEAAYNTERKTVLLSTAIFVAMSFGFLGFALFLIQAKGDTDGTASFGETAKISFTKLSPGLFVILCATVIIIFAITHDIKYQTQVPVGPPPPAPQALPGRDTAQSDSNGAAYQRKPKSPVQDKTVKKKNAKR